MKDKEPYLIENKVVITKDGNIVYDSTDIVSERLKTLEKLKELGTVNLDGRLYKKK